MAYAYVTTIKDIRDHPNADRLRIATVFGSDVITSTDVQEGWKMVYFPSDGQLSFEFGDYANLLRKKNEQGENIGGYMDEKKRNVRAISLRGSRSDGILVNANLVAEFAGVSADSLSDGDVVDTLNGKEIAKKYIPEVKAKQVQGSNKVKAKPAVVYPLFSEHADTKQLRYNLGEFKEGDILTLSLKLHGTSARVGYTKKQANTFLGKLKDKFFKPTYETVSGSRRVILESFEGGFYGSNNFRKQYHDRFDGKLRKGETVYFEIVGYAGIDSPIMGVGNNKKLKDKDFVKQYGDTTTFTYGCANGQSEIYVYRITHTDDDGNVMEYPTWQAQIRCEQLGVKHVPVINQIVYDPDDINFMYVQGDEDFSEWLLNYAQELADGADLIDPSHIREGIVVRIENREKFVAFKEKGMSFKILEGIIKEDADEPDMEEAQEVQAPKSI